MSTLESRASDDSDPRVTRIRLSSFDDPLAAAPDDASASTDSEPAEERTRPSVTGRILGGRYRLEQLLGSGGMGVVYRAADLQVPGELFAIKVLNPELQHQPELVRVLREEVRKTRVLSHPNIVGAYSVNSDEDGDYMLMEYLEGVTLERLLDEEFARGVPLSRAWPLITDMCAALAYAHDHNVIHSDLKPSNVFVTTSGKVKVLDFGIARVFRGPIRGFDAAAGGALTASHASCEMLEGGTPDVRDDVYALGCVVYEMLSGKHPFGGLPATEARALKLRPARLGALSRRQNAALARALSFDRDLRTESVEAFQSQLRPPGRAGKLWPATLATAAVLVVVGAAIAFFGRTGYSPSRPRGAAPPVPIPGSALAAVTSLSQKAAALDVDPDDPLLKAGLRALDDARARFLARAAADARSYLEQAAGSLKEAIRVSPRIATIGSTPDEIETALQLCRRDIGAGADCALASLADESARRVSLRPFEIDPAPVSNAEFARFAEETRYVTGAERSGGLYKADVRPVFKAGWSWRTLRDDELPHDYSPGAYPVRGIDHATAKAYCAWLGKRLPTEDEWEFAARGPSRRIFPWGDRVEEAPGAHTMRLWPAAKQSAATVGPRGFGGLVWEWAEGARDAKAILRGPSYLVALPFYQRLATRERANPAEAREDIGIRCARSTDAWPDASN
jgi:formylglycine-generating enzyme required for sulfatase activity